jgi:hypothetical protein
MKKILIAAIAGIAITLLGFTGYAIFGPKELKGSADVYNIVTLQLDDNLFYDVQVPVEAVLEYTDGSTRYTYDLLTIGVQDLEPSSFCKVQVGGRWVFASSPDRWLKAPMAGFQMREPYAGYYDIEDTEWIATIPAVTIELDEEILENLKEGNSYTFGGQEFVTAQIDYGTFDVVVSRALTRLSTLYKHSIPFGMLTSDRLWVSSGSYSVAVYSINYNTCLYVSACGEQGRQYAAALIRGMGK